MNRVRMWGMAVVGSAAAVAFAVGATGAYAQDLDVSPVESAVTAVQNGIVRVHFGARGVAQEGYLAEALGISEEALDAAQSEARANALADAVANGELTQEQADQLLEGSGIRGRSFGRRGVRVNNDAYLADALGISEQALDAAKEEAAAAALADAVASGDLSQEEADLINARQEVRKYMDKDAVVADLLGMTTAEVEAARAEGQSIRELLEANGVEHEALHEAREAAREAAIDAALADGVITEAQAEALRDGEGPAGRGFGRRGFGPRGGGFFNAPVAPDSDV